MSLLRRLSALFALSLMVSCFGIASPSWPAPAAGQALGLLLSAGKGRSLSGPAADDEAAEDASLVRGLPVCVASQSWSAGELGQTVLFHSKREGRRLTVGYFVYWSTERPWGKNALSYSFVPALFIDAFYSHLFFMFPGAQRFLFGPGDVEGARVVYEQQNDGRWAPISAVANNALHQEVPLSPDDFIEPTGRVVLLTNVWSHQLGASGARSLSADRKAAMTCFAGDSLSPLTDEVANNFRLGSSSHPRRAGAAWPIEPIEKRVAASAPMDGPQTARMIQ
jgi:hypothetical protein